jgi:acyl-CoA thioester hydrolase
MHKVPIHLRYSDSDQMGVVYHANYFSFFEIGRTAMLQSFGVNYYDIEKKGYIFPIRDVDCTYLKSITLGETIYCETEIVELSKVKISFEHKLVDDNGELKAIGHTSIISAKKSDFSIARMDKHLPEVYKINDKL